MTEGADERRVLLHRDERRAQILRAAAPAFLRSGYTGTTLEDVAAEAGVTKVLIYRHFAAKLELYLAVLNDVRDRVFAAAEEARTGGDAVAALVRAGASDPDGFRLLYRHARREPEVVEHLRDLDSIDRMAVEALLADHVRDEAHRALLAELLPVVVFGSVMAWLDTDRPISQDELARSIRAMTEALVTR